MECLGHIIDNRGIHADADKMQHIREWRQPRMFNDMQRFLGLVQYLAHYMPDVTTYTTPLSGCIRNNHPFKWKPSASRQSKNSLVGIRYKAHQHRQPRSQMGYHGWLKSWNWSHLWTGSELENLLARRILVKEI